MTKMAKGQKATSPVIVPLYTAAVLQPVISPEVRIKDLQPFDYDIWALGGKDLSKLYLYSPKYEYPERIVRPRIYRTFHNLKNLKYKNKKTIIVTYELAWEDRRRTIELGLDGLKSKTGLRLKVIP